MITNDKFLYSLLVGVFFFLIAINWLTRRQTKNHTPIRELYLFSTIALLIGLVITFVLNMHQDLVPAIVVGFLIGCSIIFAVSELQLILAKLIGTDNDEPEIKNLIQR